MNLRLILGYAAPYRSSLATSATLMLVETGVALTIPFLGGRFAEHVLAGGQISGGAILLLLLALFALQALVKFSNGYLMGRTSAHILADLRVRIYDHLQALPLGFYHQRRQGDVLALITYEATQLATFISGTLLAIVPLVLTAAGAVVLMFRIDPALALLVAVLVPVFYFVLKFLGRRLKALAQQLQEGEATAVAIAAPPSDFPSSGVPRCISVATKPGAMAFTLTLPRSSSARLAISATVAPFVAPYAENMGDGSNAPPPENRSTLPSSDRRSDGSAARTMWYAPSRLV